MNEAQDFMNAIMANRAIVIAASGSASSRNSGGERRTDYRRGVPHYASHQGPRLSDGNKRIAIMPALTLLGMKHSFSTVMT